MVIYDGLSSKSNVQGQAQFLLDTMRQKAVTHLEATDSDIVWYRKWVKLANGDKVDVTMVDTTYEIGPMLYDWQPDEMFVEQRYDAAAKLLSEFLLYGRGEL